MAQAEIPHYLDFKKVLNKTIAGKNAQETLSKNFKSESEKYKKIEASIKKEEIQLISKKKIIKEEEYKKEIEQLRKKVVKLQNMLQLYLLKERLHIFSIFLFLALLSFLVIQAQKMHPLVEVQVKVTRNF